MQRSLLRYFDYVLLLLVVATSLFGCMMIWSATSTDPALSPLSMPIRQLVIGLGVGLVIMFVLSRIDYHNYRTFMLPLYVIMCGSLFIVDIAGETTAGSQRWIDLGFFDWQPSETAKIALILVLAQFFATNEHRLKRLPVFLVSIVVILPPVVFVFLQPDLGTTLVLLAIWFGMALCAGIDYLHMLALVFIAIPLIVFAWNFKYVNSDGQTVGVFKPYQKARLEIFLNPESDPQNEGRNLLVSRKAVINGGLMGMGLFNGTNNKYNYLSIRHTDFIFSVIAEEFGFVGSIGVMIFLGLILFRVFRAAQIASDAYGRNICIGVGVMLTFQTFVNIGMNVGLMPVTGVTLPLISQGLSSMFTTFIAIGIVQSVVMRQHRDRIWFYRAKPVLQ
jgi:rod shape determining protein RodA